MPEFDVVVEVHDLRVLRVYADSPDLAKKRAVDLLHEDSLAGEVVSDEMTVENVEEVT